MIFLILILCAILFVSLIILMVKIINNKNTNKQTTPTSQIPRTQIPQSEISQIPKLQISPSMTLLPDEVYNKLKNYLTQQGIPYKCIDCLYTKLKIKYSETDFDKFFNDIDIKNVEENPFTTDFFQFANDCKCN